MLTLSPVLNCNGVFIEPYRVSDTDWYLLLKMSSCCITIYSFYKHVHNENSFNYVQWSVWVITLYSYFNMKIFEILILQIMI